MLKIKLPVNISMVRCYKPTTLALYRWESERGSGLVNFWLRVSLFIAGSISEPLQLLSFMDPVCRSQQLAAIHMRSQLTPRYIIKILMEKRNRILVVDQKNGRFLRPVTGCSPSLRPIPARYKTHDTLIRVQSNASLNRTRFPLTFFPAWSSFLKSRKCTEIRTFCWQLRTFLFLNMAKKQLWIFFAKPSVLVFRGRGERET